MRDMDGIVRVACRDTGKTRALSVCSRLPLLKAGVDAVFGEILVTLAKMDWIIKHGQAALAPSRRAGNLLLAHKVTTVRWPGGLAGDPGHSSREGPLRAPRHDARPRLMELLVPQPHLAYPRLPLRGQHGRRQVLGASRVVLLVVHWRDPGVPPGVWAERGCRAAGNLPAGRGGDGDAQSARQAYHM